MHKDDNMDITKKYNKYGTLPIKKILNQNDKVTSNIMSKYVFNCV